MLGASSSNFVHLLQHREILLDLLEQLTGSRIHPMFNRIGGIATPCTTDWLTSLSNTVRKLHDLLAGLPQEVADHFAEFAGVGCISTDQVQTFGLSGSLAWASNVSNDLRITAPYLAYEHVQEYLPTAHGEGDIPARFTLIAEHILASLLIMSHAIAWLNNAGDGPISVQLPKVVRAPELTTYGSIEGPLGTIGVLLDSIGEKTPWRLKLRTPAFATIQSFNSTLTGVPISTLVPMMQSCTFMVGDADR